MHSALDYIALAILFLPASALLAVIILKARQEKRERLGNAYRDESWHRQGRTAATQFRTHR